MSTTTSSPETTARQVEARRLRLENLLQIASRNFDLRVGFDRHDRVGRGEILIAAEPAEAAAADYVRLKGAALHLLAHSMAETVRWAHEAVAEEEAGQPHFLRLWHALEDARLENAMIRRWPGMRRAFDARLLPELGGSLLRIAPVNQQVETGLYFLGRGFGDGQFSPAVGRALAEAREAIVAAASGETPQASLEAMRRIYPIVGGLLRRAAARRTPLPPASDAAEAAEENEPGRASRPEKREGPPDIEMSDERVAVGGLGQRHELPEWWRPGSMPWFERGLGTKDVHPSAVRSDVQTIIRPSAGDESAYQAIWREVRREAGYLEMRLTSMLREAAYLRYGGQFRSGKLHTAKLWKQRLGVYRLFERPVDAGRSTAFSLLVDESASMKGQDKYRLAAKTAILLGEALDRLEIPLEIIGYTTAEFEARAAMRLGLTPAHAYRTTRCSALEHRIYKRFDEPFRAVRHRLADLQPRHNNWDEESLLFAFRRIQSRVERTRVILVISDGQPNGDADHLIAAARAVENLGCKVIGVGIGADYVRQIYRNAIVVADFRQMAEELLRLLARELTASGRGARRSRVLLGPVDHLPAPRPAAG